MKLLALLLSGLVATVVHANAQAVLTSYNFSDQLNSTTALTATSDPNVTAGLFSVSDGSFTSVNFTSGSPPSSPGAADSGSWNAVSPTKYFSFTIAPASGYSVSVTGISFDYRQTGEGAANFQIDIGSNANVASGSFTRDSTWRSVSPTFTATEFSGLTEIRIYGFGGGSGSFGIDEVKLYGTVSAVPEPSTYATIAGAASLAGAMWWRRRQTKPRLSTRAR